MAGRPYLYISEVTSLQDARSCAAVGFDLIGFSLARGSSRKLSVELIWNMTQWLSGPEVVISLNRMSLEEFEVAKNRFDIAYLSFPWRDWGPDLLDLGPQIILAIQEEDWSDFQAIASELPATVGFQMDLSTSTPTTEVLAWIDRSWFHFDRVEVAMEFVEKAETLPRALTFGPEAEEEMGVLDYERIDAFLETYTDRFGTLDL